jgi:hypothetical protein
MILNFCFLTHSGPVVSPYNSSFAFASDPNNKRENYNTEDKEEKGEVSEKMARKNKRNLKGVLF